MRGQRQVRRAGLRPTYSRRAQPRRQLTLRLPTINGLRWLLPLLLVAAGWLLVGRLTTVTTIKLSGLRQLDRVHVTNLVRTALGHQWAGGSLILVNTSALANELERADPGIRQASVSRQLPHTLVVTIRERSPSLNWKTGGATYLLDASATIIGPSAGPYAHLPTVTDSSNLPVKVGEQVAPVSFVTFCSYLAASLPAAGYPVASMTVPTTTSEVYVQTGSGLLLKFDTTRSPADEVADLKAVTAELAQAHKAAAQYIDLRITHKAYYK